MDFVEICNVYTREMIIKAAKRIFNFGKICRSFSDLNFGIIFLELSVVTYLDLICVLYIFSKCNNTKLRNEGRMLI